MKRLTGDAELEELSLDAGIIKLRPLIGYIAGSEAEVSTVVREALSKGLALTPRGGGTSIPSQSVGRGIILMQERQETDLTGAGDVTCTPAVVKWDLNKRLDAAGRWMPVDPSSYRSCTVGGMVSNNSSGIRTPKYGSTVDYVKSIRAIVPGEDPRLLEPMPLESALAADPKTKKIASLLAENQKTIKEEAPKVTKNSSGYRLERVIHDGLFDLPKLFAGSEGTLGVLTQVTFGTMVRPPGRVLLIVEAELGSLGSIVSAFRELLPTAIELVDKSVFTRMGRSESLAKYSRTEDEYLIFCEFDGTYQETDAKVEDVASSKAGAFDPMVLTSLSDIAAAWEVRNETLTLAMQIRSGGKVLLPGVEDLAVPPDRLPDLVALLRGQFERRGLTYISYGHAADANLHARPLLDPSSTSDMKILDEIMEESFEAVWKMGGSMTGEHGDGMLRARFLSRQYPRTYHLMKEVKETYDPKGIMNPGVKIL
ncbi:MAG: FAD-binding oxidoreductase [Thaumarchaeota archaeon]|nr:FAD-binding oxidoreductase [Nitrososphaerota archaeon]